MSPHPQRIRRGVIRIAGIAAATALASGLAACATPAGDDTDESITIGVQVTAAQSFDPFSPSMTPLIMASAYDTLYVHDLENDTFEPWLATAWEFNEDHTRMSFTLREDVEFTDGTPLNAEAVVANFDYLAENYPEDYLVGGYGMRAELTGEYTFDLVADRIMDYDFIWLVYVQRSIVNPADLGSDKLLTEPSGSGPYVADTEASSPTEFVMTRNPDYWNPDAYPYDKITFSIFENADSVALINALQAEQIDATAVDIPNAGQVEAAGFDLHRDAGLVNVLLFKDLTGDVLPAIADVRVRQAISYAIDRQGIVDAFELGYGVPTSQLFPEGSPSYVEGGDDRYQYDPERARELLAEAGYPDGFAMSMPRVGAELPMDPFIAQSLGEIGITVTFDNYPDYAAFIPESETYAARIRNITPAVQAFQLFTEHWANVNAGSAPPDIADVLKRINVGSEEERDAALKEGGELVLDKAYLVVLDRSFTLWASIPEVDVQLDQTLNTVQLRSFRPAA